MSTFKKKNTESHQNLSSSYLEMYRGTGWTSRSMKLQMIIKSQTGK